MKRLINYTVQLKFIVENVLFLLGGASVFLYGLKIMSANIQKLAGRKMQGLLSRSTSSRIKGAAVGAAVTAVIQSSTAANVMLAGFVNAGAISSAQAMAVVMGANVGTTITAQLVSLSGNSLFNVTAAGSVAALVGFLLSFSKRERREAFGNALFGLGALFIGLEIMNGSVIALHGNDFFKRLFLAENPLALVLNGLLITGVVQSSSAVSSVIILLARGGLIGFADGAYMLLGTNVGAGIAVLFVGASMGTEAKKVAVANLLFNVLGTLLFLPPMMIFENRLTAFFAQISGEIERQTANFHTLFNLVSTAVLLPFSKPFYRAVEFICNIKTPRLKRVKAGKTKLAKV